MGRLVRMKKPLLSAVAVCVARVPRSVTMMVAAGRTAPLESVMVPANLSQRGLRVEGVGHADVQAKCDHQTEGRFHQSVHYLVPPKFVGEINEIFGLFEIANLSPAGL